MGEAEDWDFYRVGRWVNAGKKKMEGGRNVERSGGVE